MPVAGADRTVPARAVPDPGRSHRVERGAVYILRERFLGLGEDAQITDGDGVPVLYVDQKLLSVRDRVIVRDAAGAEVAQVVRQMAALRPTYEVVIDGFPAAEVRRHFFTPFGDRFTIDIPGPHNLEIVGDLLDHEFRIKRGDRIVATVSRRWVSLRHTYAVEILPGENDLLILGGILATEMARDRDREHERS